MKPPVYVRRAKFSGAFHPPVMAGVDWNNQIAQPLLGALVFHPPIMAGVD